MQAQEYLRMTSDFQGKTINRVTSGLRIINAGDDAAGLAIANGFRSDQAVLSQGIRNANDGLATLQTIDGGISNISKLLDRARTLAAQSASGTYQGSRTVLNDEFQSVMGEIDRQAQAIGLNERGTFAKNLQVFIGGGRGADDAGIVSNGSVAVNLTNSTVDAKSLNLSKVQAANTDYDLNGSGVSTILGASANTASQANAGETVMRFYGSGFGGSNGVAIAVDLNGVDSAEKLAAAVNMAIEKVTEGTDTTSVAFKNAGITAKVITDDNGQKQLGFSSNGSFEVRGGDKTANALLGDFKTAGLPEGADMTRAVTFTVGATAIGSDTAIKVAFSGGGLTGEYTMSHTLAAGTSDSAGTALAAAVNADETLIAAGITASYDTTSNALAFNSTRGENLTVAQAGDNLNRMGMGAFKVGENGYVNDTEVKIGTFEAPTDTQKTQLSFSFNGGTATDVDITWSGVTTAAGAVTAIQSALDGATALAGAGLTASTDGTDLFITSSNGSKFRLQVSADHATADFGNSAFATTETTYTAPTASGTLGETHVMGGAYTVSPLSFSKIDFANQTQTMRLSMGGDVQNITLNSGNARSIDEAITSINNSIQNGTADKLKGITAVKVVDSGAEKIQFVGSTGPYKLEITGDNTTTQGIADATKIHDAAANTGVGVSASIATKQNAEAAVTALAGAVSALGNAQAVVGKGQNQFNFAVSLASTQLTNLAASESRIRDADLAAEAANLTKAQILTQAGVAALAQANSAPQAVLSLLRG
jgi:flagellin